MGNHKDLDVWKRSIDLAVSIYGVTGNFPVDEKYGLVAQMRRAAVSIASNIAEGAARQSAKEFLQFLSIAAGSASELNTQLTISERIGFGVAEDLKRLGADLDRIAKMLQGLMKTVRARNKGLILQLKRLNLYGCNPSPITNRQSPILR